MKHHHHHHHHHHHPGEPVSSGGREIQFNKEATRWLGIWIDSHLTLRDQGRSALSAGW